MTKLCKKTDPFECVDGAFAPFKEPAIYRTETRVTPFYACVIFGRSITNAAGSQIARETAGDASLSIARLDWPLPFPPRFGMRFEVRGGRVLTVQEANESDWGWDCSCTFDERASDI